jgi:hypothetical protein
MNTRGLTEIVILTVGVQLGILDDTLFSMMVVMALVTTVMAGPLLSVIYPRSLVDRDAADLQRAALGVRPAYRVLVVVPPGTPAAALVELATDVAVRRDPAEVILSRILPYPSARIEVGTGLSGDLLAMTAAMAELAELAEPVRRRGPSAPTLARFSADPAAELLAQLDATQPDVVVVAADQSGHPALPADTRTSLVTVVAPPPAAWSAVLVRATRDADGEAAVRIGADLATAHGVDLIVDAGSRPHRRVAAIVQELGRGAALGSAAPPSALVVGTGAAAGTHVLVASAKSGSPTAPPMPAPA